MTDDIAGSGASTAAPCIWVLDVDGTLLDLPVDIEAVREALRLDMLSSWPHADLPPLRPLLPAIERIAASMSADSTSQQQTVARAYALLARHEWASADRAVARPGAAALLSWLGPAPVALCSNNAAPAVARAMQACGLVPTRLLAIVGRRPGLRPKPAPDPLFVALHGQPEPLGPVICVGDRPADMAMARAAAPILRRRGGQVHALAVQGRLEDRAALLSAGADEVYPDLPTLLSALRA